MSLGLVITTHDEWRKPGFLAKAMEIACDPRIDEVVISDDCSTGLPLLQASLQQINRSWPEIEAKTVFASHPENLGVFGNKLAAIRMAKSDWVQSLDSDNQLSTAYLDALLPLMSNPNRMLCPSFAKPEFDYRERAGGTVALSTFHLCNEWKPFGCFINTGNQCFHRETFLDVMRDIPHVRYDRFAHDYFEGEDISDLDHRKIYDSADSLCFNKLWLLAGKELLIGPGLEYEHAVHEFSSWKAAPELKEALPPIYFRELLDAARGVYRRWRFMRFASFPRTQRVVVVAADGRTGPEDMEMINVQTGRYVRGRAPQPIT